MTESQTQRTLENVCLFCNDELTSQSICKFCGFKFCPDHMSTENHQCIKTRYVEYIKKTDKQPNVSNGKFRVVCNTCGYMSKEPSSIEYAGEELIQHMQMVGCPQNILLEEVITKIKEDHNDASNSNNEISPVTRSSSNATSNNSTDGSVVEQILKLAEIKEKGMISEEEFEFIKKELINKLK